MPLKRNIMALRNPLHPIFLFTVSEGYEKNKNEDWSSEFMNNNFSNHFHCIHAVC